MATQLVCVLILVVLTAESGRAQTPESLVDQGRRVFFAPGGCHGCHTAERAGTQIGPDLSRVASEYSRADLERWLRDQSPVRLRSPTPRRELNEHRPRLVLSEQQARALAAFISSLQ